jgi:hypothetical protein
LNRKEEEAITSLNLHSASTKPIKKRREKWSNSYGFLLKAATDLDEKKKEQTKFTPSLRASPSSSSKFSPNLT